MGSLTVTATDASGATATASAAYTVGQAPELIEFVDFVQQAALMEYAPTGSLVGKGPTVTTHRMRPFSSTKASKVPTAAGSNNPLFLIHAGGLSSPGAKVDVGNMTLEGTDQGHLYHGVRIGYGTGSTVHDMVITGIPGNSSSPPGETATLSFWRTVGGVCTNVTLDGRRTSDGAKVAASLLEYNYTTGGVTAANVKANWAQYGFAVAMFQAGGANTFTDCDFRNNRKAINIEQALAGSYKFTRCDFRGNNGGSYHTQISTLGTTVSCPTVYEDCLFDNDLCMVNTYPGTSTNGQKNADIRRIDGGVDLTANPAKFKIVTF